MRTDWRATPSPGSERLAGRVPDDRDGRRAGAQGDTPASRQCNCVARWLVRPLASEMDEKQHRCRCPVAWITGRPSLPLSYTMRTPGSLPDAHLVWTISTCAGGPRAHACFGRGKQASAEAGPACPLVVPSSRLVSGDCTPACRLKRARAGRRRGRLRIILSWRVGRSPSALSLVARCGSPVPEFGSRSLDRGRSSCTCAALAIARAVFVWVVRVFECGMPARRAWARALWLRPREPTSPVERSRMGVWRSRAVHGPWRGCGSPRLSRTRRRRRRWRGRVWRPATSSMRRPRSRRMSAATVSPGRAGM